MNSSIPYKSVNSCSKKICTQYSKGLLASVQKITWASDVVGKV